MCLSYFSPLICEHSVFIFLSKNLNVSRPLLSQSPLLWVPILREDLHSANSSFFNITKFSHCLWQLLIRLPTLFYLSNLFSFCFPSSKTLLKPHPLVQPVEDQFQCTMPSSLAGDYPWFQSLLADALCWDSCILELNGIQMVRSGQHFHGARYRK